MINLQRWADATKSFGSLQCAIRIEKFLPISLMRVTFQVNVELYKIVSVAIVSFWEL